MQSLFSFKTFTLGLVLALALGLTGLQQTGISASNDIPTLPAELRTPNKVVMLDFYADWCGTCQNLKPYVDSLYKEYGSRLQLIHINVDNGVNRKYVQLYGISGTPTYILFDSKGKGLYRTNYSFSPKAFKEEVIKATKDCPHSC